MKCGMASTSHRWPALSHGRRVDFRIKEGFRGFVLNPLFDRTPCGGITGRTPYLEVMGVAIALGAILGPLWAPELR